MYTNVKMSHHTKYASNLNALNQNFIREINKPEQIYIQQRD